MLTDEEYEKLNRLFIKVDNAAWLPKNNPFVHPMGSCIESNMVVFHRNGADFVSTCDFAKFCKEHFLDVDTDRIQALSFKLEDIEGQR